MKEINNISEYSLKIQTDTIAKFLLGNGYEEVLNDPDYESENMRVFIIKGENVISIKENEMTFTDENGVYLSTPTNIFALIGGLIHFKKLNLNYKYETN